MGRGLLAGKVLGVLACDGAAQPLTRTGATVALLERSTTTLDETCRLIEAAGRRALAYPLDITDHEAYRGAVEDAVGQTGGIDILVNNAAIARYGSILEDTLEDWRAQIAVNLEAVYMGSKLVAPHMVERGYGRIISIASIMGFVASGEAGAYNAAKGGIIAFTKSLAVDLAPYGVAANAIAPGFMRTPMSVIDGIDETTTDDFRSWYVERRKVPMARTGLPEDVAGTAVFLASDYCRYMTGQTLVVDGGLTSTF